MDASSDNADIEFPAKAWFKMGVQRLHGATEIRRATSDDIGMARTFLVGIWHDDQSRASDLLAAAVSRHPKTKRIQLVVEAEDTKVLTFYGRHGFFATSEVEEEGPRSLIPSMDIARGPAL